MAIDHWEIIGSRDGTDSTKRDSMAELAWMLRGSNDPSALKAYLIANSVVPRPYYDGLIYKYLKWEQHGPELYRFGAHYVEPRKSDESNDQLDVGEYRTSFDTQGGMLRLYWTPDHTNTVKSYGRPTPFAPPADYGGAIDVKRGTNGHPEPQGAERVVPVLKFTIHYRRSRDLTEAAWFSFMKSVASITGSTNNATFKTFAPRSVLFLGGTGQQGIESDPVVDFHFAVGPNLAGLIYDTITGVSKDAHDFIWLDYEPTIDTTADVVRPSPIGVYVHQLYSPADLAGVLGTGA